MGKEVRANGLDIALGDSGEGTDRLEVLFGSPALRQGGESNVDNLDRCHCGDSDGEGDVVGRMIFLRSFFSARSGRPPITTPMIRLTSKFYAQVQCLFVSGILSRRTLYSIILYPDILVLLFLVTSTVKSPRQYSPITSEQHSSK